MKKIILLSAIALSFIACNTKPKQEKGKTSDTKATIMIPQSTCYLATSGKDSIWLKLEVFPNVVTGILNYDFYEKDQSKGHLEGKLIGDKLYADYTYTSEGQKSIRQVSFLITDSTATEGFGELIDNGKNLIFKDSSAINYTKGLKFHRIDCVTNAQYFR